MAELHKLSQSEVDSRKEQEELEKLLDETRTLLEQNLKSSQALIDMQLDLALSVHKAGVMYFRDYIDSVMGFFQTSLQKATQPIDEGEVLRESNVHCLRIASGVNDPTAARKIQELLEPLEKQAA
jgi:hypothetical protein